LLYSLAYAAARALLGVLARWGRLSVTDVELLVLRHEARTLRRFGGRDAWGPADRLVLAAPSRRLPRRDWRVFPVHPATLRRWHRELLQRSGWVNGEGRGPGRPPLAADLRALIERLARENVGWGYRRIRGELLKLGHDVSPTAIRMTLRRHGVPPAPRRAALSWPMFLRAQAAGILAEAAPVAEVPRGHALAVSWFVGARIGRVSPAGRPAASRHRRSVPTAPGAPPPGSRRSLAWSTLDHPGAMLEADRARMPPGQGQPMCGCNRGTLSPARRPRYPPRTDPSGADCARARRNRGHRTAETALRLAA
jgi:hypothetical protein